MEGLSLQIDKYKDQLFTMLFGQRQLLFWINELAWLERYYSNKKIEICFVESDGKCTQTHGKNEKIEATNWHIIDIWIIWKRALSPDRRGPRGLGERLTLGINGGCLFWSNNLSVLRRFLILDGTTISQFDITSQ